MIKIKGRFIQFVQQNYMLKKFITASVLGTMLLSSVVFARSTSTASSTNPGSEVRKANSACVRAAVDKKNAAINAAQDIFKKAMDNARIARNSALQAANSTSTRSTSTDRTARQAARRTAQKAYRDATKAAQDAFRTARKTAQDHYRTDIKACRVAQKTR